MNVWQDKATIFLEASFIERGDDPLHIRVTMIVGVPDNAVDPYELGLHLNYSEDIGESGDGQVTSDFKPANEWQRNLVQDDVRWYAESYGDDAIETYISDNNLFDKETWAEYIAERFVDDCKPVEILSSDMRTEYEQETDGVTFYIYYRN